ncbi:MAG: hypothetical protein ABUT39_12710 [Acidobacteriota bacterium]
MKRLWFLVLALTAAGCASPAAPPPSPAPAARTRPAAPEPEGPRVSLVCAPGTRRIPFQALGVQPYTQILDAALDPDHAWLLVDQSHVIEIGRQAEGATFRTIAGSPDARWAALDVDPKDGSLWAVSMERLELIHLVPGAKSQVVPIPNLEGEGGFRDVLVDDEAIYVVPTCAQDALWKLDRSGKVLERSFHRDDDEPLTLRKGFTEEEQKSTLVGCVPVSLAHDPEGRVTVFDGLSRTFSRRESGTWAPFLTLPAPEDEKELTQGGVRVSFPGTEGALWTPMDTASGNARGFFFLDGGPVFQPGFDAGHFRGDPGVFWLSYVRPSGEGLTRLYERCVTNSFSTNLVATDRAGYVSAMGNELVLGSFPAD